MSSSASLTTIAVCQIILTAATFILTGVLIYAMFAVTKILSAKIDYAMSRIQPVLDKAESIAEQAKDTTQRVSGKVDSIVSKAETTAEKVSEKVEEVSSKVDEAVTPRIAAVAGLAEAAAKLFQAYRELKNLRSQKT